MEEQAPLSLELRTIKKRQRIRGGTAALIAGIVVLGVSIAAFLQPGAIVLAIFALIVGGGLCGAGGYVLHKAKTSRW